LRSLLIFSTEFVFGPVYFVSVLVHLEVGSLVECNASPSVRGSSLNELTNGADDGGPAEVFGRIVLGVELGQPLDSSASSVQMVESVRHIVSKWISRLLAGVLGLCRKFSLRAVVKEGYDVRAIRC
jgi:hypothetical protein